MGMYSLLKVFIPTAMSFFVGIGITPLLTSYFYKYRLWKRVPRKEDLEVGSADKISPQFKEIHNTADELHTPRIGGSIIWISVLITAVLVWFISLLFPVEFAHKINFVSRNQTLIPLFAFVVASLVGLFDDFLGIFVNKGKFVNGFPRGYMLLIVSIFGLVGGLWFYFKLGVSTIHIPFDGMLNLGLWFIPFFIVVTLATFSSGVIDGIDGLAGGVMATIYTSYGAIAYFQGQVDIAVMCLVVAGAVLAFLWFNIPPARFYMGETGMLGLTTLLTVVSFLTGTVLLLPLIALPLALTSFSSVVQIISKKYFGKKVFRVAPLHHHFESLGWSRYKITMRYWVISVIFAIMGIIVSLVS